MARHKLIGRMTHSGSDCLKFYDMGDDHIGVVHMDLWEDMDSDAVAEFGKYNVMSGSVCIRGFESYGREPGFIGQSVHDSLLSCGYVLTEFGHGLYSISEEHSGDLVVTGSLQDCALAIAECMWGYGAKDVACDVSGHNLRKLEKQARNAF
jgi:hypothetical protein